MKTVSQARATFLVIAGVFLLLDIVAAIVLLTPAGRSPAERSKEYEDLRTERMQKEAEARPTRDMDKKLIQAREEIGGFYSQHLPASYSDISEDLGKVSADHRIALSSVRYETRTTPIPALTQVMVTLSVTGDYRAMMDFINALERDKRMYLIDRVMIQNAGVGNEVRVEIQLETYLRNAA